MIDKDIIQICDDLSRRFEEMMEKVSKKLSQDLDALGREISMALA